MPAVRRALERAGRSLAEFDVIEFNKAFATQSLAANDELGLDEERVNPNGGPIALGHPVTATGGVIATNILSEMRRRDPHLGLVTLCIGCGQGAVLPLERG